MKEQRWEYVVCGGNSDLDLRRVKVEGGHIYRAIEGHLVFVPDVDLARYQSHLRDAYNQGLKDGQAESDLQRRNAYQAGLNDGKNEGKPE